jgi:cyclase
MKRTLSSTMRHACVVALVTSAGTVASGRTPAAQPASAAPATAIHVEPVQKNIYLLASPGSGNITVQVGSEGVLMVDSGIERSAQEVVAAIRKLAAGTTSPGRVRYIINTHVHPDHVGGNENIGKLGATIFARENLRARMLKPAAQANGQPGVPAPALAVPTVTYDAPLTFHVNGEDVRLIPVPAAHTDGDTMVYFPNANVIMTGDFYRSTGYPNIDRANGGTMNGMLSGFDAIVALARADTKIVPGHGAVVDKTAVAAHKAMMMSVRDKVAALVTQGKTQEEVVAAKVTNEFDARVTGATPQTADRFVGQLYQELKK